MKKKTAEKPSRRVDVKVPVLALRSGNALCLQRQY